MISTIHPVQINEQQWTKDLINTTLVRQRTLNIPNCLLLFSSDGPNGFKLLSIGIHTCISIDDCISQNEIVHVDNLHHTSNIRIQYYRHRRDFRAYTFTVVHQKVNLTAHFNLITTNKNSSRIQSHLIWVVFIQVLSSCMCPLKRLADRTLCGYLQLLMCVIFTKILLKDI